MMSFAGLLRRFISWLKGRLRIYVHVTVIDKPEEPVDDTDPYIHAVKDLRSVADRNGPLWPRPNIVPPSLEELPPLEPTPVPDPSAPEDDPDEPDSDTVES